MPINLKGTLMRRYSLGIFVLLLLCLIVPPQVRAHDAVKNRFAVMSRNLYVGANLGALINGPPSEIFERMAKVFKRVNLTNFEARADEIVDEIQNTKPLLIGLQEVALWRTQEPADGPVSDAQDVAFDFLDILMDEIASRGLNYEVLSVFDGFDIEVPADLPEGFIDVRFTDRLAILGNVNHHFEFSNAQQERYDTEFAIPTGFFGDIVYPRAWQSVDVLIVGSENQFRFINTHLEAFDPSVNEAQAQELVDGPAITVFPAILAGDFNAAPNDLFSSAYGIILDNGFDDAWEQVLPGVNGFTCCQKANLRNEASNLSRRIDYVFVRNDLEVQKAHRVGHRQIDRTPGGLWPSDHAGVVARVRLID